MKKMAAVRFREDSLLGTGGMAEVWRAQGPQGPVALKRLLPHAARNPSLAAAFEREGRLLARIDHPNVVGIHEIIRDERGTCLVLEYVEGADLRALSGHATRPDVALRIIHDLLHALEAVHGLCDEDGRPLGLIHRDLSPSNVLVGVNGTVKLTDFGIARAVSGSHATTGQSIKGTLAYLSPEQATGAPVDARADLFAAGALLYELLAGVPIYNEDDPRLALARARAGDVGSLASVKPDLPLSIVEFVDRALAAHPTDRFPNATVMRQELERVAARTCGLADDGEMAEWACSLAIAEPEDRRSFGGAATTLVLSSRAPRRAVLVMGALLMAGGGLWFGFRGRRAVVPSASGAGGVVVAAISAAPAPSVEPGIAELARSELPTPPASTINDGLSAESRLGGAPRFASKNHAPAKAAPSPPATPTPAPAAATASEKSSEKCLLDIGSEPAFAYVTIDGVRAGATPLFGREVSPGTHHVQVSRDGLGSKSFTVEVRPGDRISRVVKLP